MQENKEAIAIVLDVGRSMHDDKEHPTVLENAKSCVNMILERKIFSESKDEIALILFGTTDTVNDLAQPSSSEYTNIKVVQDLKPASWELLEYVNDIKGTDVPADFIKDNALLVAINLLQNTINGKKFFSRRLLFLSLFEGIFSSDKVNTICQELQTFKIDLNIIGPVAIKAEEISNGNCLQSYQNRSQTQKKAENIVQKILKEVKGESYSFSEALPALVYYQKKKVQPIPWNANLDIGTNLSIPISAYIKVNENKPKSWKNAYARKLNAKLEKGVAYLMNDEFQTKVSKDNIIPAFKYGTTLVPYTEEDKFNMDYQSGEKGMKVLGFTKAENVHRYHYIGDKSMYIFGQKNRELAGVILAPFIQALHDTKMVAIVRYVYSPRSAPKIGFLYPKIKSSYECLIFIALPFMEDLRHFIFAPLDCDPKNLPTDEQLSAVDDLINSMDLSEASVDEAGNKSEILKPKYTVNPYLQRLYQCLQYRAFHPEKPLPEMTPQIKSLVSPSPTVLKNSESAIKRIKTVFPIKAGPQKRVAETGASFFTNGKSENSGKKGRNSDSIVIDIKPSVLDAVADKITKVGSVNPVRDFQQLIISKILDFAEAFQQVVDVVYRYLHDEGTLKLYHTKILSICKELRNASLKKNDSMQYNIFMTDLKVELLKRDPELWNKIKSEQIGLISVKELNSSLVSPAQADDFLDITTVSNTKDVLKSSDMYDANEGDEYGDLLEQL